MRSADERLKASIMISNSIRCASTGGQVGCTMKTSPPRTFSNIWKLNSPSGKRVVFARPSSIPRYWQISSANGRLALPENICRLFTALCTYGWGGRIRTYEWRLQRPLPYHLATPQQTLTASVVLSGKRAVRCGVDYSATPHLTALFPERATDTESD